MVLQEIEQTLLKKVIALLTVFDERKVKQIIETLTAGNIKQDTEIALEIMWHKVDHEDKEDVNEDNFSASFISEIKHFSILLIINPIEFQLEVFVEGVYDDEDSTSFIYHQIKTEQGDVNCGNIDSIQEMIAEAMSIPEIKRHVNVSERVVNEKIVQKTFSELVNEGGITEAEINFEETTISCFSDYVRTKVGMIKRHKENAFVDFRIVFCDKETERELTFELLNGNPFTVLEVWHDRLERSKQQYQTMSEVFDYIRGTVEKEFMLKKIKGTRSKR